MRVGEKWTRRKLTKKNGRGGGRSSVCRKGWPQQVNSISPLWSTCMPAINTGLWSSMKVEFGMSKIPFKEKS